jgi:hypothetical protein
MYEFFSKLLEAYGKSKNPVEILIILISGILVGFLINLDKISDFLERFSDRKLRTTRKLIQEQASTGMVSEVLQESMNAITFELVHGIKANRYLRDAIIDLCESSRGRLNYSDFRKVAGFLGIGKYGNIEIQKFNLINRWASYLFFPVGFTLWILISCLWVLLLYSSEIDLRLRILAFGETLPLLIPMVFWNSQYGIVRAIDKIQHEIDRRKPRQQVKKSNASVWR